MVLAALATPCPPRVDAPKRVLVYTQSSGFEHEVARRGAKGELSIVEKALDEIGRESGKFDAIASRDTAEFGAERLATYDAVFFYTTGELPLSDAHRKNLIEFVEKGKAFVGAHCAADTLYKFPAYGEMLGAYFDGHPWTQKVRVKVEDRTGLATAHLGESFEIDDEIYQFKDPYDRSKLHVLLSLDTSSVDAKAPGVHRTDGDFALAWTKQQGRGRVFYTALGHRPEVWADRRFRTHLLGGLRWAMGEGDKEVGAAVADASRPDDALRAFALEHEGDARNGYAVFRRSGGAMCSRCHAVNGVGGNVGPDLSDVGKKRTRAEIVADVLTPSARIEPGYVATMLELDDGTFVSGLVKRESRDAIELWDANGELRTLSTSHVARRSESKLSLMPDGLARLLGPDEFADLVAYLATLKVAPAPAPAPAK